MPFMPPMGGPGATAPAGNERSDASGLLGGQTEPWVEEVPAEDADPHTEFGAPVGGELLFPALTTSPIRARASAADENQPDPGHHELGAAVMQNPASPDTTAEASTTSADYSPTSSEAPHA